MFLVSLSRIFALTVAIAAGTTPATSNARPVPQLSHAVSSARHVSATAAPPALQLAPDTTVHTAAPAMAKLAKTLLETYQTNDQEVGLDNLFRLQVVAGEPAKALETLAALRHLRIQHHAIQANTRDLQFAILAEARGKGPLTPQRFAAAFHHVVGPLDDRTTDLVMRKIDINPDYLPFAQRFADALTAAQTKPELSSTEALALVRTYQRYEAYRVFAEHAASLGRERAALQHSERASEDQ